MKIPFDKEYRPQIESGKYKLETRDGRHVRIICWDMVGDEHIVALISGISSDPTDPTEEIITYFDGGNFLLSSETDLDLFIITQEEERSRFDDCVLSLINTAHRLGKDHPYNTDKDALLEQYSAKLIKLAREDLIKDGYVIEKKAFHDAVAKVVPGKHSEDNGVGTIGEATEK